MEDTRIKSEKPLIGWLGTRKMQAFGNGNLHLGSPARKLALPEVAQQVAEEYFWTLDTLRERGLIQPATLQPPRENWFVLLKANFCESDSDLGPDVQSAYSMDELPGRLGSEYGYRHHSSGNACLGRSRIHRFELPFLSPAREQLQVCTGGCTLNDAFDEQFDRRLAQVPLPSGRISQRAVWSFGFR